MTALFSIRLLQNVILLSLFSLRATASGVLNALCKLAAVLSSSIFASCVGITKAIPILLSFTALVCGGLVALNLPDTQQKILQWSDTSVLRWEWGGVRKRPKHIYFLLEANEFTLTLNLKKDKTWNNSQLFIRTNFFRLEVLDQEKAGLCFSVFLYESLLMPWIH